MRHRETYSGEYSLFPNQGSQWNRPLKFESIDDVNNGRLRPESPCTIIEVVARPISNALAYAPDRHGNINVPLNSYVDYIKRIAADDVFDVWAGLDKRVQKQRKSLMQQFSTINFMSELREVGSLFKRADNTWRHFSEVRGIDYQFGVAPMIADLLNALKHYDSVANRANELTKRYRNIPIDTGMVRRGNAAGPISFFSGNAHHSDDFFIVKGRVKGELSVGFPRLALVNPEVFFMLDRLAINPSLANFWEAVPFSWLLDWFLPAGEFLSTLPDLMSPDCHFTGTQSVKIKGHSIETTLYSGPGFAFYAGAPAGEHRCSIYERRAESWPLAGRVTWDFMGGINSLAKASILRDIIYPAKEFRPKNPGKRIDTSKPKPGYRFA